MLFFIIFWRSHAAKTRSCSKTVIIKTMSQTHYLHKFPSSQRHERNHFTVFFLPVGLAVLINPWQKAPSPETFHFLFWLSLLQRLLHSLHVTYTALRIQTSQLEAQIVLSSMAYIAYQKDTLCLFQTRPECVWMSNKSSPYWTS